MFHYGPHAAGSQPWSLADQPPPTGVDLSANPYDLRPAVKAIMDAQNWILERIPPKQKLIILMGEIYTAPTHTMLCEAVLDHLADQRRLRYRELVYGMELPHNFPGRSIFSSFFNALGAAPQKVSALDTMRESKVLAKRYFNKPYACSSTYFNKAILNLCLERRIPFSFNDVARIDKINGDIIVDQKDPKTRALIDEIIPELKGQRVYRASETNGEAVSGLKLSNTMIAKLAIEHANKTGAQIIVQQCGLGKIFGDIQYGVAYKDSLTHILENQGFCVLPVFPSFETYGKIIPKEAYQSLSTAIKISNLKVSYPVDTEEAMEDRCKIKENSGYIYLKP